MANNLRKIRTEQGISQSELARRSGVSRQTINKIEADKASSIKTTILVKLADALDHSVAEIFFN